jgi:hypothetical protein
MELTNATSREELVRKYRELSEKHERLLQKLHEKALERTVVSRLSRATLQSRHSALALVEGRRVVAANPAWRLLDIPSQPRQWNGAGVPPQTHPSLLEAALDTRGSMEPSGSVFTRVTDGVRVRLRAEHIPADGALPASILLVAIDDAEPGSRQHRVRNHLAAALLQARLLQEECGAASDAGRRAAAIGELVRLASLALEPPQTPR